MKLKRFFPAVTIIGFALALEAAEPSQPSTNATRVACIGDSITFGVGVKDLKADAYPAQLARMLGDRWEVKNYGVSGATMMNKGDRPYQQRAEYKAALASKPDVVVIALGTNDSKPQNFEKNPDDFLPSYRAMVNSFRETNPRIKVFVCLPVPAFPENGGIRDSVISGKIIPEIQRLAQEENLFVIDLHSALDAKSEHFPDKVHPNKEGARLIAKAVAAAVANDLTKGN
ncbi:MAG TPA: GDSL-type esterase/lipase family protein [Verrucomicrobiae bacterium]|nr:GDSL-type esterase/lipase family protein [Verrucomicrobiae bacterium]